MENQLDNKDYFELSEVLTLVRKSEDETVFELNNTPFHLLKKDGKYYLTVGKYAIEECKGIEEAVEKSTTINYDRIMKIVMIAIEQRIDEHNNNKKK